MKYDMLHCYMLLTNERNNTLRWNFDLNVIVRTIRTMWLYYQIYFSDKIPLLVIPDILKCQPQFGLNTKNVFRFSPMSLLSSRN